VVGLSLPINERLSIMDIVGVAPSSASDGREGDVTRVSEALQRWRTVRGMVTQIVFSTRVVRQSAGPDAPRCENQQHSLGVPSHIQQFWRFLVLPSTVCFTQE